MMTSIAPAPMYMMNSFAPHTLVQGAETYANGCIKSIAGAAVRCIANTGTNFLMNWWSPTAAASCEGSTRKKARPMAPRIAACKTTRCHEPGHEPVHAAPADPLQAMFAAIWTGQ